MDIAKAKQKLNHDSVFVIVGRERVGKSTLMMHCVDYLGGDISSISLDKLGFVKALYNAKEKGVVVLDEAGDTLFSRDALNSFNKDIVKTYSVIGGQRLITFLVLPDFFMLDRYFREHRVRALFFVFKRGRYSVYCPHEIKSIILKGDKYIPRKAVVYADSFPDYKGRLLDDYLKLKKQKIDTTIQDLHNKYENAKTVQMTGKDNILFMLNKGVAPADIVKLGIYSKQYVYTVSKSTVL